MVRLEIIKRLSTIISINLKITKEEITLASRFESLESVSLDIIEILIAVDDEFNLNLPNKIAMNTIGELAIIKCNFEI